VKVAELTKLRRRLNPFKLAQAIDHKLTRIFRLASRRMGRGNVENAHAFPHIPSAPTTAAALVLK
jgi:hypothetical protein